MTGLFHEADLNRVDPLNVLAYLQGNGWAVTNRTDRAIVATMRTNGQELDILLPLVPTLRDYSLRVAEVIRTLATVEDRDARGVLNSLLLSADIVRLTVKGDDTTDGTIALERAPAVFENARSLMLAAACSALEKRPVHPNRKPEQALRFVREARMGQTERGSYVVTLAAPVPRVQTVEEAGFMFPELNIPFGRTVTTTLQTALASMKGAAKEYRETGRPEVFRDSVEAGVSANLCESILAIAQPRTSDISVDISWSRIRPQAAALGPVAVVPEDMPPLEAAVQYFHELAPDEGFRLTGWVTRLHRERDEDEGDVTIIGMTEQGMKSVRVLLSPADFDVAIVALRERRLVECIGTLRRTGNRYRLEQPQSFGLLG